MATQPVFEASTSKPYSQYAHGQNLAPTKTGYGPLPGATVALLRDNFTIPTWLLLGCLIQTIIALLMPGGYAAVPAATLLLWGITNAILMKTGWKHNKWMDGVMPGKLSVAYPADDSDDKGLKPGVNGPGAVMILGAKSNSPYGMFEDGYKEVADRFKAMIEVLEKDKDTNGFMGMSSWIAAGERNASNELTTISYWRSIDDVHAFALSPVHRDAWRWWAETIQKHNMLGIMHEIFEIPKKSGFEGLYINYRPTGMAATTKPVQINGLSKGEQKWVNPIVDASRGLWRTSHGRMLKGDEDGSSNDEVLRDLGEV